MKCVGFERLTDYLDGRLSGEDMRTVAEHLDRGCDRCEADRRWYGLLTSMKGAPESIEPPAWVFRRAVRLFENRPRTRSIAARAKRMAARLVFDSAAQPAQAGARSSATSSRHLLYAVDDFSIDLRIAAEEETGVDLVGQVLSVSESGFDAVAGIAVGLHREGETLSAAATDEIGVFKMTHLEPGEYGLQIDARDVIIDVAGLQLSH